VSVADTMETTSRCDNWLKPT